MADADGSHLNLGSPMVPQGHETPFFLVHGAEAVLPVEVTHEAPRVMAYDEVTSKEALQDDVDTLDEARDKALERATQYQQSL
jgi:hypothetical protein